jgi:hypothetical protein
MESVKLHLENFGRLRDLTPGLVLEWPKQWFGRAVRVLANGKAMWRVDVSHFEEQPFYSPLYNQFIENDRNKPKKGKK